MYGAARAFWAWLKGARTFVKVLGRYPDEP